MGFRDRYIAAAYYRSLITFYESKKSKKSDITFVELKFLWHIFSILTAQYCAAAHSLRITAICYNGLRRSFFFRGIGGCGPLVYFKIVRVCVKTGFLILISHYFKIVRVCVKTGFCAFSYFNFTYF